MFDFFHITLEDMETKRANHELRRMLQVGNVKANLVEERSKYNPGATVHTGCAVGPPIMYTN